MCGSALYLGAVGGFRYRKPPALLFGQLAAPSLPKGRGKSKFALKLALELLVGVVGVQGKGGGALPCWCPPRERGRVGAAGPCPALQDGAASPRGGGGWRLPGLPPAYCRPGCRGAGGAPAVPVPPRSESGAREGRSRVGKVVVVGAARELTCAAVI